MKKVTTRILALMTAVAILPLYAFSLGDSLDSEPTPLPLTAVKQELAAQAQPHEEFKLIEELPENPASDLTTAPEIRDAHIAEQVAPESKAVGIYDKELVTLLKFGAEFLVGYLRGLNNLTSRLVDTGGDLPEYVFEYEDDKGKPHSIYMGMYHDEENNLLIGRDQQGAFRFGFDFDLQKEMMYASYNGVERKLGFTRLYDKLAPLPVSFTKHAGSNLNTAGRIGWFKFGKGSTFSRVAVRK